MREDDGDGASKRPRRQPQPVDTLRRHEARDREAHDAQKVDQHPTGSPQHQQETTPGERATQARRPRAIGQLHDDPRCGKCGGGEGEPARTEHLRVVWPIVNKLLQCPRHCHRGAEGQRDPQLGSPGHEASALRFHRPSPVVRRRRRKVTGAEPRANRPAVVDRGRPQGDSCGRPLPHRRDPAERGGTPCEGVEQQTILLGCQTAAGATVAREPEPRPEPSNSRRSHGGRMYRPHTRLHCTSVADRRGVERLTSVVQRRGVRSRGRPTRSKKTSVCADAALCSRSPNDSVKPQTDR